MAREMKNSGIEWIGIIPKNWETIKIKYTSWLKGRIGWQGLTASEYTEEGPFLVTGTDFQNGKVNWASCAHISKERFDEDSDIHIKEGDLLITKDGTVGKVAIAKNCPDEVSLNSGVLLIRNVGNYKYYDKYLYYVLLSDEFWRWYTLSQTGQSTIKHLYQAQFYSFEYTYPVYEEQVLIANYLDTECARIDAVIEQTRASIEEYKKLKQAVITQAVTKGIRPNRPMKDSGIEWIGEIPSDWNLVPLKRLAKIQTGNTPSKTDNDTYYSQESGYLWIKPENLGSIEPIKNTSEYLTEKGIKVGRLFPPNTVFVCCIASIGKVGFSNIAASCNQQINGLVFHNAYWKYGFYLTMAQESEYILYASGNVMKIINSDKQSGLMCPFPPIDEQYSIADFLDSKCSEINTLINKKEQFLIEIENYKKSLIYEYVTGKKEVPA